MNGRFTLKANSTKVVVFKESKNLSYGGNKREGTATVASERAFSSRLRTRFHGIVPANARKGEKWISVHVSKA